MSAVYCRITVVVVVVGRLIDRPLAVIRAVFFFVPSCDSRVRVLNTTRLNPRTSAAPSFRTRDLR